MKLILWRGTAIRSFSELLRNIFTDQSKQEVVWRSLMRSSGHFRSTETMWRWQLFAVASDPDVAGATPLCSALGRIPLRSHDHAHAVNKDFVLNRYFPVSQQPLYSLRSRSQEPQMRFSCLDATEYFFRPRCLEVPHGVTLETDFITDGPFILLGHARDWSCRTF